MDHNHNHHQDDVDDDYDDDHGHQQRQQQQQQQQQQQWFPRSYDSRRVSNNENENSFLKYYEKIVSSSKQKEWQCISPMTQHHILPHPTTTTTTLSPHPGQQQNRIRKRRSRSFNDYIDRLESTTSNDASLGLTLPSWKDNNNNKKYNKNKKYKRYESDSVLQQPTSSMNDNSDDYAVDIVMVDDSNNMQQDDDIVIDDYYYGTSDRYTENETLLDQEETMSVSSSYQKQFATITKTTTTGITDEEQYYEPIKDTTTLPGRDDNDSSNPLYVSILYGAINCTIVIPVVMSFGNIIYRDDAFGPYMPVLIKLTLVSGFVHQICFSTFSSLKFAVGSVQDAGLIFLSSMAADLVAYCRRYGHDDATMLATTTVGLSVATALLGMGLVVVGKLRLAGYVQMLPTCVVAGYLAYIGWFVGYSGLGIMVGASTLSLDLLVDNFVQVLPGIAGGIFIYGSVQKFRHVAVLPLCITMLLLSFYIGLAVTKTSIQDATTKGWIRETEEAPVWYHTWDYLQIDKVVWSALPQLWLTWSGMLFVVALSSSLDVAAIELEMKKPLNYNKELSMVGISNFVSGMTGGYTGSYIFSQSIFSLRIGIRSRMAGFALAFFQLVVILVPFPVLSYVPNFFYGSLLSMICMDLMYEWLWEFRSKVTVAEYLIALVTFGFIHLWGVEYGILIGVVLYVCCRQLNIDVGELKQIPTQEDQIEIVSEIPDPIDVTAEKDAVKDYITENEPLLTNNGTKSEYNST
jgi:MFS superfamily sulfate permease-like transporter